MYWAKISYSIVNHNEQKGCYQGGEHQIFYFMAWGVSAAMVVVLRGCYNTANYGPTEKNKVLEVLIPTYFPRYLNLWP